jgi:hypothetical protein
MEVKKVSRLKIIGLIGIGALALAAFSQMMQQSSITRLQQEPLDLQVGAIQQSESTSCGEAVIVMAYNYAYPQAPINEGRSLNTLQHKDILRQAFHLSPARWTW